VFVNLILWTELPHDATVSENGYPVAVGHRFLQPVGHEHNRATTISESAKQLEQRI
jgi:hypothetical protein